MEEKKFDTSCEEMAEMWQRVQEGAEYIVRYFSEKKFTVADAKRTLDAARRGIEAETTVNMRPMDANEECCNFW